MSESKEVIPEAAVEAAAKAWCGSTNLLDWQRRHISKILEAAGPHLLAELRGELIKLAQEFDATADGTLAYTATDGRFVMRKNAHDQLMYIVENYLGEAK